MSERTAREKFAEAMLHFMDGSDREVWVHQAIDAFADATCEHLALEAAHTPGTVTPHDHAACRASLRKECGL